VVQKAFKKAGKNQVYAPAEDTVVPYLEQKVVGENGVSGMQPRIQVGYVGKPKGVMQLAWERGWVTEGMSTDQATEALEACPDYFNETTIIEELFVSRGHILIMSPKGHPELAGVGVEYSWGKSKLEFRRSNEARNKENLEKLVLASLSLDVLPLARIRKFARKARSMRELYKNKEVDTTRMEVIERLAKKAKTHRSTLDQSYAFIQCT